MRSPISYSFFHAFCSADPFSMVLSPVSAVSHFLQCSACLLLAPLFTSHLGPQAKCGQSQLLWPSQQQHMLGGGSEEAQWSGKWEARDSGNAHPASTLRNRGPRCSCSINPLLRLLSFMLLGAGPSKMHELQDTFGNSSPFELVFIFR